MKNLFKTLLLIILFCVCIYPAQAKNVKEKSMLEVRNIETHYYNTTDTNKVLKAVTHTLQDNGFIIQNMEEELGYIKAKKELKAKRTEKGRVALHSSMIALGVFSAIASPGNVNNYIGMFDDSMRLKSEIDPHTVVFILNGSVETVGSQTKVRLSIVEEVKENADGYTTVKSSTRNISRHLEPETYQDLFRQIDKNLFIEKL